MRLDLSLYAILAFLLVVVLAVVVAALAEGVRRWAAGLLRRSPRVAAAGLGLTAFALVNTLVSRACVSAPEVRNRPLLAALTDNPCRVEGLLQVGLVVVAAAVTTVAVGQVARRRPHPHAEQLVGP